MKYKFSVGVCLFSPFVFATHEPSETELLDLSLEELFKIDIVSIATGKKQSILSAPATTHIIDSQAIQAMNAKDLDEILETVPGLHVSRHYFTGNPIYTLRGLHSFTNPHLLLLINDIPINTLMDGNRGRVWAGMPVEAIAKIEVISGPGSALYGADAVSGVINIYTKTAEELQGTKIGARLESFNTQATWLQHGTTWQDFNIGFSLEYFSTDGHKGLIQADQQSFFDNKLGLSASNAPGNMNLAKQGYDLRLDVSRDLWRLRLGYQDRDDVGAGIGIVQALDNKGEYRDKRFNADLNYHNPYWSKDWDVKANVSFYRNSPLNSQGFQYLYPEGGFNGKYPDGYISWPTFKEQHIRLALSGFYAGFDQHLIRIGTGFYLGDMYHVDQTANFGPNPQTGEPLPAGIAPVSFADQAFAPMPEAQRKNFHAFIQDTWTLNKQWEITSGLRYDHYSDFGSTLNPRVAIVWKTTPKLTNKLLYGQAFRAPAFNELYNIHNPMMQGNPDLNPEEMETWELNFTYLPQKNLQLGLNLYYYQLAEKINYRANTNNSNTFNAQNAGEQETYGGELEMRWQINKAFSINSNYAYQHSHLIGRQTVDGAYAPEHQVYTGLHWKLNPAWTFNSQINWIGKRARTMNDTRDNIASHTLIDAGLRYQYKHWDLRLGVRNLLNQAAKDPSPGPNMRGMLGLPEDIPLAKRNYFFEVRYQFD